MSEKKKGGRKLVRSGKDKGYYDRQYYVTETNKAHAAARILRRKVDSEPHVHKPARKARRISKQRLVEVEP